MPTASDFIDRCTDDLNDPGNDIWSRADLLRYLGEGLQLLGKAAPDQFVSPVQVTLVAGPKQSLPAGYRHMVRPGFLVVGGTRTRALRKVSRRALDRANPTWGATSSSGLRGVAYDTIDPLVFWVTPPAAGGEIIETELFANPAPPSFASDSTVDVSEMYHPGLLAFMKARAFDKDDEYAINGGRADKLMAMAMQFFGVSSGAANQ